MVDLTETDMTDDGVYAPSGKIALAFSFEGFVNDGAPECGLTTFNANAALERGKGLSDGIVEPAVFDRYINGPEMVAFLRLRPLVNKAYQYFFVIDAIRAHPTEMIGVIEKPMDTKAFDVLIDAFKNIEAKYSDDEKKALDEAFYAERKRMQDSGYDAWLSTQRPFPEAVPELRYLTNTQVLSGDDEIIAGFIPYFATSKDERSTWALCTHYVKTRKMDPDAAIEGAKCVIPRERIIGKETIETRNDVDRLRRISDIEELGPERVWRINDRYDTKAQEELYDAGFHNQILVPGYTFPHDFKRAKAEGRILVIESRTGMAKEIGNYARASGF